MRCPVVVGRAAELAVLRAAVEAAAAGRGMCVLVSGEAGVGKSRLVQEAAGAAALLGRASPHDQESPLRPFTEALLAAARSHPRPDDPALAPYLPAVAALVPHWADPATGGSTLPPGPVILAEGVLRALCHLAGAGGLTLVLEDLHWADRETLAVLEYLSDHLAAAPLALLLTVRSDEPGSAAAVDSVQRTATRLRLAPLGPAAVSAMVAACLRVDVAPPTVLARLAAYAGGLPLVVEDLMDGDAPGRYSELVARRVAALAPATRAAVAAAAVLGPPVLPEQIAAVTRLAPGPVAEALRAATASGLFVAGAGGPAFRHALVRDVVLAGLYRPQLAELSRAAAQALERLAPDDATGRLGELWAAAGEPERAARMLRRAAAGARAAGAADTAHALLRRALMLTPADGTLRLELLELLADSGQVDELATRASAALDELAHDADLTAAVHLLLARAAVTGGNVHDTAPHLDAVRADATLSLRRRTQLRIVEAQVVMAGDGRNRAAEGAHLAGQAVALADRYGDAELGCEALEQVALSVRTQNLHTAADALRRALTLAERSGLALWRLRALNELGAVEILRDARPDRLLRARELALRLGAVDTAAGIAVNLAAVHAMTGRVDETRQATAEARALAGPLGIVPIVAAATMLDGLANGYSGDRTGMARLLRAGLALAPADADLAAMASGPGHGISALLHEDRAGAGAAFERARSLFTPVRALDPGLPVVLLRAVAGTVSTAEVAAELVVATVGARWSASWLGYAHAVTLAADGDRAAAEDAFRTADGAADRYPLFRAVGLRLVAEAALTHPFGEPVEWLRDAETEFVRRGLHRVAAACRGLLARAGAPTARRRGCDVALPPALLRLGVTAREAEVLDLVGEPLSNKDIAGRLFLSPRTVEKHVASLLAKTGAADRSALVRLARES